MRRLVMLVLSASLVGCVPHLRNYTHLEVSGATYRGEICGMGAPVTVTFEADGVQYTVNLDPGSYAGGKAWMRLRVQEDMLLAIADPRATFIVGDREIKVELEPSDWTVLLDGVLRKREIYFEDRTVRERFTGASIYTLRFSQVPDLKTGEVQLPDLTLGSSFVPGPRLRFERRAFVGVLPFNC